MRWMPFWHIPCLASWVPLAVPIMCMRPLPPLYFSPQSSGCPLSTVNCLTQHNSAKGPRHGSRTVCSPEPCPVTLYSCSAQLRSKPAGPPEFWLHIISRSLYSTTFLKVEAHPWGYSGLQSLQMASRSIRRWLGWAWSLCGSDGGGVRCCARALHAVERMACVLYACITCQLQSLWPVA